MWKIIIISGVVTGSIFVASTSFAEQDRRVEAMDRLQRLLDSERAQIASGEHVEAGTLTCEVSGGTKVLNCSFVPTVSRPRELHFYGTINKLSIDLGDTKSGVVAWTVYAPTRWIGGSLAGTYVGSAEGTEGGINILAGGPSYLVGGPKHTVELQPVSVQEQTGINIAAGIAEIELHFELPSYARPSVSPNSPKVHSVPTSVPRQGI
jgi:Protein of unknown function (DUF992)